RKFFQDVHLWLGLSSGLIVIAICLSGTIYVFNTELTERAASHLYKVEVPENGAKLSVDSLASIVQQKTGAQIASVLIPEAANRTYQFAVKVKGKERNVTWMINPYTGLVLGNSGEKNGTKEFMGTMFSLHRWLLLDKIEKPIIGDLPNRKLGSIITGTATIIFTLGCLTGLLIWFPKKIRHWRQGLKIKFRANWKRLNHDLHNTLAFYSLIFLLLMGLTGPQWSFEWYREGLQKTLGTYKSKDAPKEKKLLSKVGGDIIPPKAQLASIVNTAKSALPFDGDLNVTLALDTMGTVNVARYHRGFFASPAADRITLDQYSLVVLKREIFKEKPTNERIAGSIKALHVGNVYGMFTKILYFIACLIATSLPITGTIIWINKWKKKLARAQSTRRMENVVALD
ncbi:MAG: PepSY domain-containing protein, partial [Chitinophagaceae bacterium]|nr:PepSY domain-containing protein [Chitinophagaceae bacterium]